MLPLSLSPCARRMSAETLHIRLTKGSYVTAQPDPNPLRQAQISGTWTLDPQLAMLEHHPLEKGNELLWGLLSETFVGIVEPPPPKIHKKSGFLVFLVSNFNFGFICANTA